MSKWIDGFENHAFQKDWTAARKVISSLKVPAGAPLPDVEEIARLKKIFVYVDELISAVDLELVPVGIWNSFTQQATNILNQIATYQSNSNIGHIANANTYMDNIITYISPYARSSRGAALAAGKAFKAYSDTINKQIEYLETESKSALETTEHNKVSSEHLYSEMRSIKDEIDKLKIELLTGSEDEMSLQARMEALSDEVSEWHDKTMDFHKQLTSGNEEESSIILQIDEARNKATTNADIIESVVSTSEGNVKALNKFHEKVFGVEGNDGKREGGLSSMLKNKETDLTKFKDKQEKTYKALIDEIESLLPGATTVGLAVAYSTLKDSFDNPIKTFTLIFYGSLVGLLATALIMVITKIDSTGIDFITTSDPKILIINLIQKLPVTIPFLWLTLFASKRISQDKRLQQEYAHKEALAKSYQSFKKQVESVSVNGDDALLKKLLETTIDTVGKNASSTLDGKHNDKVPLSDLVKSDEFIDLVKGIMSKVKN